MLALDWRRRSRPIPDTLHPTQVESYKAGKPLHEVMLKPKPGKRFAPKAGRPT